MKHIKPSMGHGWQHKWWFWYIPTPWRHVFNKPAVYQLIHSIATLYSPTYAKIYVLIIEVGIQCSCHRLYGICRPWAIPSLTLRRNVVPLNIILTNNAKGPGDHFSIKIDMFASKYIMIPIIEFYMYHRNSNAVMTHLYRKTRHSSESF